MPYLDVRGRPLPRLDAIEEVADVRLALPVLVFDAPGLDISPALRRDLEILAVDVERGVRAMKEDAVALPVPSLRVALAVLICADEAPGIFCPGFCCPGFCRLGFCRPGFCRPGFCRLGFCCLGFCCLGFCCLGF